MKLAFCLFRYFPYGGLQRDFVRIAKACRARGHEIEVYTMRWEGERFPEIPVTILPVRGWQNHTRIQHFIQDLQNIFRQKSFDRIIGFNKMPGLDIYYAADGCLQDKYQQQSHFWHHWLPRYRTLLAQEEAVFASESNTRILLIAKNQQEKYMHFYQTPAERFHLLPPGIQRHHLKDSNRAGAKHAFKLLFVGSGFRTKGLDRALTAIAAFPEDLRTQTQLIVIGQDYVKPFMQQAQKLKIASNIQFLGGRNDVFHWMHSADILIHPARFENTGTVLLEALTAGLPVLTTDVCGYAHYVTDADAGIVLPSPFDQEKFSHTLQQMIRSPMLPTWRKNALAFSEHADIFSMPERAAQLIETLA